MTLLSLQLSPKVTILTSPLFVAATIKLDPNSAILNGYFNELMSVPLKLSVKSLIVFEDVRKVPLEDGCSGKPAIE